MRLYRRIIIITTILNIILMSIVISIEYKVNFRLLIYYIKICYNYDFEFIFSLFAGKRGFVSNVSLGLFTSSFLTFITSIIGYKNEKIKLHEKIYMSMVEIHNELASFKHIVNYLRGDKFIDNEIYMVEKIIRISSFTQKIKMNLVELNIYDMKSVNPLLQCIDDIVEKFQVALSELTRAKQRSRNEKYDHDFEANKILEIEKAYGEEFANIFFGISYTENINMLSKYINECNLIGLNLPKSSRR